MWRMSAIIVRAPGAPGYMDAYGIEIAKKNTETHTNEPNVLTCYMVSISAVRLKLSMGGVVDTQ